VTTGIREDLGRVLVIGATGSIGRLVVERFPHLGLTSRALSRDVDRARRALGPNVEIVGGSLTDNDSLAAALADVDAVVMTHGAPYGSGNYEAIDYGAVPAVLAALGGREVRIALMSSIGVTGNAGSSRELLDWKRRGERLLRASGLSYTIVRPGWFDAGTGAEQHVDLRQGDRTEYGPVRRIDVAETLVQAIRTPCAVKRTVEVFSIEGAPITDWESAFAATQQDQAGSVDGVADQAGLPFDQEPPRVQADLSRLRSRS
jgi:uncharacterized protein YbjT (DUF2867 family)